MLYLAMALVVTATTFTRGIYLSFILTSLLLLVNLLYDRQLKPGRMAACLLVAVLCLSTLLFTGCLDKVIGRLSSGISLVFSTESEANRIDVDSFSGRMKLAAERFQVVMHANPLVGLGFIHEDNVPPALRSNLHFGSVVSTPAYLLRYHYGSPYVLALYSADIGWANLVLMTGVIGFLILVLFLACYGLNYYRRDDFEPSLYHYRLAFFLQTVMMAGMMFNGDTFVSRLQVACFMIAGYTVTTQLGKAAPQPAREAQ
jgi:hypothetical protein